MKLGIIGLPNSGKKTLFKLLTGIEPDVNALTTKKAVPGFAEIKDNRFRELVKLYSPKKEGPAKIDIQLLPDFDHTTKDNNNIFFDIANVDAICIVTRDFNDDSIYHVAGSIDSLRDIEIIYSELIMHDLLFIEKRLERIEKTVKKKDEQALKHETDILIKFKEQLEQDLPLSAVEITQDQKKIIQSYPFLTRKEILIALNVDEDNLTDTVKSASIQDRYKDHNIFIAQTSLKVELEISSLAEDEKIEFMEALEIKESSIDILTQLFMKALGLISFFTVGKDEVKQWLVRTGSTAPEAASAIHSDIQRGFIRAEVMKYNDLIQLKSEEEVKKSGKLAVMGKDYIVIDGDIISFRFNV